MRFSQLIPPGSLYEPRFHLPREWDNCAFEYLRDKGTLVLLAPACGGKTWLASQILDRLRVDEPGFKLATVDLKYLTRRASGASSPESALARGIAAEIAGSLKNGEVAVSRISWERPWHGLRVFLTEVIPRVQKVTIVLDHVEALTLAEGFSSPFEALIRDWATASRPPWGRNRIRWLVLDAISGSKQMLAYKEMNPIDLDIDITPDGCLAFAELHGIDCSPALAQQLIDEVGGQAYLCRTALCAAAAGNMTLEETIADPVRKDGPFAAHLRAVQQWIEGSTALSRAFDTFRRDCAEKIDWRQRFALVALGVVSSEHDIFRQPLYAKAWRVAIPRK